jgi:DNA recombination protein RmuC
MAISTMCMAVAVLACGAGAMFGALLAQMRARGAAAAALARGQAAAERVTGLERELEAQRQRQEQAQAENARLTGELRAAEVELESERRQGGEKLALVLEAREALSQQFQVLANQIFEDKSKRFTDLSQTSLGHFQTNLGQILEPLKGRLHEFQSKVEQVYVAEGQERMALKTQVEQLMKLNQQLSSDANNLTRALKGESKTQGNWGELVLERILEAAGLRKGQEYETQASFTREDNSRGKPDVIVRLPEGKRLVIDAKVSLVDYNDHVNAGEEGEREAACARHIVSVRGHIRELAERRYQNLPGLETVDFVIMFVPIEPAFLLAIGRDPNLWTEAWGKNVLLVSPSTLLFVLRTVAHLWRQEQQSRNVQEISQKGARLYDELAAFAKEMTSVGKSLKQAQGCFDEALHKLAGKKGNVIRQAEMLKDLGVKPTKAMPADLLGMDQGEMAIEIAAMAEDGRG